MEEQNEAEETKCAKDEGEASANIKVCIRIRPPSPSATHQSSSQQPNNNLEVEENTIVFRNTTKVANTLNSHGESYTFDKVFDAGASNYDVYRESGTQKIVKCVTCEGHHGAAFAYGKTGSGKTHTMVGNDSEDGVISLALRDFFQFVEKRVDSAALRVKVSYLEVYNEECRDLLAGIATESNMVKDNYESDNYTSRPAKKSHYRLDDIQIFDGNAASGVIFRGLTEVVVSSANDALVLVKGGEMNRRVESTGANERSSRSHSVFRIVLEFHGSDVYGSLSLVDLAGQESLRSTLAEGERLTEGNYINKSLSTLGLVIWKLSENTSAGPGKALKHIPYRDSKLTRILRQSLSGHARLAIICTVSSSSNDANETCNTLKFAARAKRIKQIPGSPTKRVNNEDKMLRRTYLEKIKGLEQELENTKNALRDEKAKVKQVPESATPSIVEIRSQPTQAMSACTLNDLEDLESIAKVTLALENVIPLLMTEEFRSEHILRNQKSCSSSVSSMTNEKDRLGSVGDSVADVVPQLVNALKKLHGVLDKKNQESLTGLTVTTQSSYPTHSIQEYSSVSRTLKRSVVTNDHPLKLDTIKDNFSFEEPSNLVGRVFISNGPSSNETQRNTEKKLHSAYRPIFCTFDESVLKVLGSSSELDKAKKMNGQIIFKTIPVMFRGVLALLLLRLSKSAVEITVVLSVISTLFRLNTTSEKTKYHYFAFVFFLVKAILAFMSIRIVIICARVAIIVHYVARKDTPTDIRCLSSFILSVMRAVTSAIEVILHIKRYSTMQRIFLFSRRKENVWLDEDDFSDISSIQAEDCVQIYDVWNVLKNQYLLYGGGNTLGVVDGDFCLRPVLSSPLIAALREKLPYALSNDRFWMKYSSLRDGASISSLYQQVGGSMYTIIAIESSEGFIFGSFTTQPWRMNPGYFGTRNSFLWRMVRSRHTPCTSLTEQAALESDIDVFPATGKNECFQFCSKDKLAVGGWKNIHIGKYGTKKPKNKFNGDDSFGLCIDRTLMIGTSRPCSTYMNPCLAGESSKDGSFAIANIEVWALTPCKTIGEAEQMESFTRM